MSIESFLYQLVKSTDKEIVIYYQSADIEQLKRLNKYCSVVQYHKGIKIQAHRMFFNFNLDPLINGDVEADENILIVHGNYKWLECNPPQHEKINEVYAVSKDSAKAYTDLTGIPCKVVYNPLKIEKKPTLMLMSATRIDTLTENIKGGSRMIALSKALDKYCKEHDYSYQWHTYSNQNKLDCNIQILKPTIDIAQYMTKYDYVVQLSDNVEGFNYTVHEALNQSVPIVATHCDTYKECNITDDMAIWLDFDLSNIDKVVEDMFKRKFNFKYKSPTSEWDKLLYKSKEKEVIPLVLFKVKATKAAKEKNITIPEAKGIPEEGDIFEVTEERLETLLGHNSYNLKFIDVIDKEVIKEKIAQEVKKRAK